MFMAAAHAASLWADSPVECADAGLSVVPRSSRLAEALEFARTLEGEWEARVDTLYDRYGEYHWVHAINNTALVAAALYAFDDFDGAICGVVCAPTVLRARFLLACSPGKRHPCS